MCHHSPQQKSLCQPAWPWSLTRCWHLLNSRYQVPNHPVTAVNIIPTPFSLATESRGEEQWELQDPWCSHLRSAASLCCLSSLPDPRWVHHIFPEMLLVFLWKGFLSPFKAPTHHNPLFICQNKTYKEEKEHFYSLNVREAVSNLSSYTCSSASGPSQWSGSTALLEGIMQLHQLHSHSTLPGQQLYSIPTFMAMRRCKNVFECKGLCALQPWLLRGSFGSQIDLRNICSQS